MSKQVSRLIGTKQFVLSFDNEMREYLRRDLYANRLDLEGFENFIANRFPNIKRITMIESFHHRVQSRAFMNKEINGLFEICNKNFLRLDSISYIPAVLYTRNVELFVGFHSHLIKSLDIIHYLGEPNFRYLAQLKKLKSITIRSPHSICLHHFQNNSEFFVKNLEKLVFPLIRSDIPLFPGFLSVNTTITHLSITSFISVENNKYKVLRNLFCLKSLKRLSLHLFVSETHNEIFENLKAVATHCTLINCLNLQIHPASNANLMTIYDKIIQIICYFKKLKILQLYLLGFLNSNHIKSSHFKQLHSLEALSIYTPFIINESLFINMNINIPKLRFLRIESVKFKENNLNDLSLCENLQVIYIITPDKLLYNLYKHKLKMLFNFIPKLHTFKYNHNFV